MDGLAVVIASVHRSSRCRRLVVVVLRLLLLLLLVVVVLLRLLPPFSHQQPSGDPIHQMTEVARLTPPLQPPPRQRQNTNTKNQKHPQLPTKMCRLCVFV
jgi:hypothetical protein